MFFPEDYPPWTLPEPNIAREDQWLQDENSFWGKREYFQGLLLLLVGRDVKLSFLSGIRFGDLSWEKLAGEKLWFPISIGKPISNPIGFSIVP